MNRAQLQQLHDELMSDPAGIGYAQLGENYPAIAAALNETPMIQNPQTQPVRPKLIAWNTFIGLLTAADVLNIYKQGNLASDLRAALARNDRNETSTLWRGLKLAIGAESIAAVQAAVNEEEPDPNWRATIAGQSRATVLGLPVVTPSDVQAVLA